MSAPEPISALAGHLAPRGRDGAGVAIAEQRADIVTVAARRDREAQLDAALQALLNIGLPSAGRATTAGDVAALTIAPGTAVITGPARRLAALREIPRDVSAVIDQSGGFCTLRVAGPMARAALAKGCRIDLHASAFGPGGVARTIIAQTPAIIRQVDAAPTYDIIIPRTLARSFMDFVVRAAEEFGVEIAPADSAERKSRAR